MLGGEAPVANQSSCPGASVASQTSTMAGDGGMAAAGNRISAKVSVVMAVLGETGVALPHSVGMGLASWARLARGTLISSVSMTSTTKAYRRMFAILLGVVTSGRRWRRRHVHERTEPSSQLRRMTGVRNWHPQRS
jgi:hypothetical protein